jgi:hypothetical protein
LPLSHDLLRHLGIFQYIGTWQLSNCLKINSLFQIVQQSSTNCVNGL